jgi:hypothetical protein
MSLSSVQLGNDDGEEENLLVRQPFQWGSEKRRVQKIAVAVEAEIVDGNIGLAGFPRVIPFKCERTGFAKNRNSEG